VKRTGPSVVAVLLQLSRRRGCAPSLDSIAEIGGFHLGLADRLDHRIDVDLGNTAESLGDAVVLVEDQRRREPRKLERPEGCPLAAGCL
jgi:hypothetical protein